MLKHLDLTYGLASPSRAVVARYPTLGETPTTMFFKIAILVPMLATPGTSWTTSAYMNLVVPPRWTTDIGDAYMVKAGVTQPGAANHLGSCLNKRTPANVTRSLFPASGGSLVFSFTNNTASPSPDPTDEKFSIDMYFTDDHVDYSPDYFFRWGNLVRRMEFWQGFETGWTCSVPFDMTSLLRQPDNETAVGLLDGMNMTIALLVSVGRGPYRGDPNWGGTVWEEVDQVCFSCAYITLTTNKTSSKRQLMLRDENQDMCNRVNLDYFGSSTTSSALPTATGSLAAGSTSSNRASINLHLGAAVILPVLGGIFNV
ncbi:hypothetical protein F5884DRAFT_339721 [Xylogone sp. PMI_703]|nr:hypothetical protein F5884DRAFT_339721 [Xylogone sp. PMI_703]